MCNGSISEHLKITVLNVAYPLAPVGPDAVGGAEQVLSHIDAALVRAGHRSIVLACEGSHAAGELVATPRITGTLHTHMHAETQARYRVCIGRLVEEHDVDLVHLHGLDFHTYLPRAGVPVLVTLHMPPTWHAPEALFTRRPDTFLHCVTRSQQAGCPAGIDLLPAIENGVPLDPHDRERHGGPDGGDEAIQGSRRGARRNFVMTLSRICPEKGIHLAIAAAECAGVPSVIAGQVFPFAAHQEYFARQIEPQLGGRVRFIGPIGVTRKRRLLRAARALLVASTVAETSSLAAMEALACGTPVIAFRVGALPEIVKHNETGFLVRDVAEMAAAINEVERLDPEACRAEARRRFSVERMTACYLERYAQIVRNVALRCPPSGEEKSYAA
jgi:glycosyltransferase involved in cell wall biosynthesis